MKNIISVTVKTFAIVIAAVALYSCSKDDNDNYTFAFNSPAAYFNLSETQTASYTKSSNVTNLSISTSPAGWTVVLDTSKGIITVTAPSSLDDYEDEEGNTETPIEDGVVVVRGYVGKKSVSASFYVSLKPVTDFSGKPANCFILTNVPAGYIISATRPDGSAVEGIETVELVWSTQRYLIRYPEYKNGKISFTTYSDNDDFPEGNALLAAKDSDGNILWCWHLWVTEENPEESAVELNGNTFMGCNLGAFANSADDHEQILASYGLYYQWGRPSPFPRPRYYNCANGTNEPMFTPDITNIYMSVEESDGTNDSMAEAIANPLTFVTDMSTPWSGAGSQPWDDTRKSNYDPCPAGWRVPAGNVFEGLTIVSEELQTELSALREAYGWTLTDGERSAYFFAGGRRTYLDGNVVNMNTQERPQPWEGFYWTTTLDASRQRAAGLFFDLDTEDAAGSRIETGRWLQLSNGLQVRCVRER